MEENLLELSTEELLNKFGAGNHKPGSGSAAAFQGMLSAKLLVTVISLTNEEKRRKRYADSLPRLLQMHKDIQDRIFPELARLFQEDSIQFGKTITSRKERDNEKDPKRNNILARQALEDLRLAIDLPLRIANFNVELAEMASFVFDNAFQGARGDTQVALSSAISAIAGCLSIVRLNLLQYGCDEYEWVENIRTRVHALKAVFEKLQSLEASKIEILASEVKDKADLHQQVNLLLSQSKGRKSLSDREIESYAIRLQQLAWKHREKIWKKDTPSDPIEILKPETFFKSLLSYNFYKPSRLGLNQNQTGLSAVAGEIDQEKRIVLISGKFSKQVQNFTAAHELGHAILHNQALLHRDLPIGDPGQMTKKSLEEQQADKFASYFLMPEKQILEVFQEYFFTNKFSIDQNTAFNLIQDNPSKLRTQCKDMRGLSRRLARTKSYANHTFTPLAELFKVSVEAMAIRLEELGLVEF